MLVDANENTQTPLVSIIVPAYKHEDFVIDCLRSLHSQTYPNIELIFIDDFSPDHTFNYVSALMRTSFSDRFENVILRRQPTNQGAHTSLNLGLELANGEYIAIINSDDLFRPRRIEVMLEAMQANGSELAFSAVDVFETVLDPELSNTSSDEKLELPPSLLLLNLCQQLDIACEISLGYALLRKNVAISTGNFVLSKNLAGKVGGFQPLKYCHDWDFILQSLLYSEPTYVPEILYDYRHHQANTFRSVQDLASVETEVVIRRFFKGVVERSIFNPLCPSPARQPGYFEAFITAAGYNEFWRRENNLMIRGQRVYHQSPSVTEPKIAFHLLKDLVDKSGKLTTVEF